MRPRAAADAALSHVDSSNWREQLNQLHREQGSWQSVAQQLGMHPATLRRYRAGGYSRGGQRRQLDPGRIQPGIRKALRSDRKTMIRRADFSRMRMKCRWRIDDTYDREQNMNLGPDMDPAAIEKLTRGYLAGDREFTQALNNFLRDDYAHVDDARIQDVEWMEF